MMEILKNIGYAVLVLVATPIAGMLLTSFDRKLSARMQGRIGPSWLQPYYDLAKLFSKKPMALHRPQLIYATLHLVFMMVAVLMLAMGCDLLMVLFVQAFSMICLVLAPHTARPRGIYALYAAHKHRLGVARGTQHRRCGGDGGGDGAALDDGNPHQDRRVAEI